MGSGISKNNIECPSNYDKDKLISESKPRKATKPTKASQMRRVESKKSMS